LHASVPLFRWLGVLAGDQAKGRRTWASRGRRGLFYTKGYSDQRLRLDGCKGCRGRLTWRDAAEPVRGKGDPASRLFDCPAAR